MYSNSVHDLRKARHHNLPYDRAISSGCSRLLKAVVSQNLFLSTPLWSPHAMSVRHTSPWHVQRLRAPYAVAGATGDARVTSAQRLHDCLLQLLSGMRRVLEDKAFVALCRGVWDHIGHNACLCIENLQNGAEDPVRARDPLQNDRPVHVPQSMRALCIRRGVARGSPADAVTVNQTGRAGQFRHVYVSLQAVCTRTLALPTGTPRHVHVNGNNMAPLSSAVRH